MEEFDDLFDSLFKSPENSNQPEECCNDPYVILDNGNMTCTNCGQIGQPVFQSEPEAVYQCRVACYKRANYFRELLYLFSNVKLSNSPKYPELIRVLKEHKIVLAINGLIKGEPYEFKLWVLLEIDITTTMRSILRMIGMSKFYKHIYNIILDVFDFRVFNISRKKIEEMTTQFYLIEKAFKQLYPGKPNMLSYKVTISHLFRRNGIINYPFILKPINYKDVFCLLSPVFSEIQ